MYSYVRRSAAAAVYVCVCGKCVSVLCWGVVFSLNDFGTKFYCARSQFSIYVCVCGKIYQSRFSEGATVISRNFQQVQGKFFLLRINSLLIHRACVHMRQTDFPFQYELHGSHEWMHVWGMVLLAALRQVYGQNNNNIYVKCVRKGGSDARFNLFACASFNKFRIQSVRVLRFI